MKNALLLTKYWQPFKITNERVAALQWKPKLREKITEIIIKSAVEVTHGLLLKPIRRLF